MDVFLGSLLAPLCVEIPSIELEVYSGTRILSISMTA